MPSGERVPYRMYPFRKNDWGKGALDGHRWDTTQRDKPPWMGPWFQAKSYENELSHSQIFIHFNSKAKKPFTKLRINSDLYFGIGIETDIGIYQEMSHVSKMSWVPSGDKNKAILSTCRLLNELSRAGTNPKFRSAGGQKEVVIYGHSTCQGNYISDFKACRSGTFMCQFVFDTIFHSNPKLFPDRNNPFNLLFLDCHVGDPSSPFLPCAGLFVRDILKIPHFKLRGPIPQAKIKKDGLGLVKMKRFDPSDIAYARRMGATVNEINEYIDEYRILPTGHGDRAIISARDKSMGYGDMQAYKNLQKELERRTKAEEILFRTVTHDNVDEAIKAYNNYNPKDKITIGNVLAKFSKDLRASAENSMTSTRIPRASYRFLKEMPVIR